MATLRSEVEALFEPGPSQALAVSEAESVWVVQSGKLDLFIQSFVRDEGIEGARHHICRIEAGEAVFGIPLGQANMRMSAVPLLGTKLIQVSRAGLQDLQGKLSEYSASLLEQWINSLSQAASEGVAPKKIAALVQGRDIDVAEEPQVFAPIDGVVWVDHLAGSSLYRSESDLFIRPGCLYPVAKQGWLEAAPGTRLRAYGAADVPRADSQWEGLQLFHTHVCSRLIAKFKAAEEREEERLRDKDAALSISVHNALSDLAGALADSASELEIDSRSDTLLLACRAVGRVAEIEFIAPKLKGAAKSKDPVWQLARASAVRVRKVVLKNKWWTQDSGPMLVFRESDGQPMALLPRSPRSYELYDPVTGKRLAVDTGIATSLNGIAYSFYRPFPEKKLNLIDLLAFGLRSAKADFLTIILMGVAGGLLNLLVPIATGIMFDSAIPGAQRNQILVLSSFLLVGAVSSGVFALTRNFAVLRLEGKMDVTIQAAVWDRLLRLPVPFFRQYSSGDLAVRSLAINEIRESLTGSVLSSILSGLFSIFSFGLLFYYSWRLALVATLLSLVAFLLSTAAGYLQVRYQREVSRVRGRIAGMVLEFVNGISKFRTLGAEGRAFAVWAKTFAQQKRVSLRARKIAIGATVFNSMIPILCWSGIFLIASRLFRESGAALSTGSFLAFFVAFNQFLSATLQLSTTTLSVLGVVPLYERAKPILESSPEVDPEKTLPGELTGNIEVNNVIFRYSADSPLVLRGLSISARPGEFVAVVGQSGCGKSTLLRLLLGFEKPESGAIYFDGQDLAGLDLQALRQQIGVVLQNGRLVAGTVLTNIIGSAALTAEDALEAARMAGLEADIKAMPMGLHTVISEGGGTLSGGQRQRLMIARAVVAKPRILLFDEATSALDNETQAVVSRSLESLRATRIVIAHRLSTVINADRIFVLEKGALAQAGTYQELMAQEGIFRDLAKRQLV